MKLGNSLLVIEDEPAIMRYLRSLLDHRLWRFLEARSAESGLHMAVTHKPGVILLDLSLPDGSALSCLKTLRHWAATPVILISAVGQEEDRREGIAAGADDYLIKPFGIVDLCTRLDLALRRVEKRAVNTPVYERNGLRVDLFAHRVWLHNKEIHLSPTEYEFLAVLVRHAGRLVSQSEIMKEVWGETREVTLDAMRVFVHQLRQKIETDPVKPSCLKTESGFGYGLESPAGNIFKKAPAQNRLSF